MSLLRSHKNGHTFLLVCTDIYSRFMQVALLKRKDTHTVAIAMQYLMSNKNSRRVSRLLVDKGKEFYNKHVEKLMAEKKHECTVLFPILKQQLRNAAYKF